MNSRSIKHLKCQQESIIGRCLYHAWLCIWFCSHLLDKHFQTDHAAAIINQIPDRYVNSFDNCI